jgi:hypothetical protein
MKDIAQIRGGTRSRFLAQSVEKKDDGRRGLRVAGFPIRT